MDNNGYASFSLFLFLSLLLSPSLSVCVCVCVCVCVYHSLPLFLSWYWHLYRVSLLKSPRQLLAGDSVICSNTVAEVNNSLVSFDIVTSTRQRLGILVMSPICPPRSS